MRGAEVNCRLFCPSCREEISSALIIVWGRTPSTRSYRIGDQIDWAIQRDGNILNPFQYRKDGVLNFGDPKLTNVIIMDEQDLSPEFCPKCSSCNTEFDGGGVLISNNCIVEAKVFLKGELFEKPNESSTIIERNSIGKIVLRHDLDNHVLSHPDL